MTCEPVLSFHRAPVLLCLGPCPSLSSREPVRAPWKKKGRECFFLPSSAGAGAEEDEIGGSRDRAGTFKQAHEYFFPAFFCDPSSTACRDTRGPDHPPSRAVSLPLSLSMTNTARSLIPPPPSESMLDIQVAARPSTRRGEGGLPKGRWESGCRRKKAANSFNAGGSRSEN